MDAWETGIKRFPHEKKQNKTKHWCLGWSLLVITVMFTNFVEGSARITINLNWAFASENNITKSITKCLLRLFVSTLHCLCPPAEFLPHLPKIFFVNTSMLNLTKSICVNTRAESSSFACIFSSKALIVFGQSHRLLVTLYRFGKRLTNWPWSYNTIFPYFSSSWTHIFTMKI